MCSKTLFAQSVFQLFKYFINFVFLFFFISEYYSFICTIIVCEGIGLSNVLYNLVTQKNIFASKKADSPHSTFLLF